MSPHLAYKLLLLWIAALATGFLLLLARPAHGQQLDLAWFDFPGMPGAEYAIDFACDQPDSSYRMVATFTSPVDIPDLMGMEALIGFGVETGPHEFAPPLPDFWHFEGCNAGGLQFGYVRPAGAPVDDPWEFGVPYGSLTGYSVYEGTWSSSITVGASIARYVPTSITAGKPYFAFTLDVLTCLAGTCSGCGAPFRATFSEARLIRANGQVVDLQGWGQVCINMNGWCGVYADAPATAPVAPEQVRAEMQPLPVTSGACAPVPVRPASWGALKIRYR